MRQRASFVALLFLLLLVGLSLVSLWLLRPPAPVPASAPASEFSAERAMQHVRQIARQPHAMGTAAHAEVRRYLLQELAQLGLNPQVQESAAVYQQSVGHVYNVLGRLKGSGAGSKAILLMAHYDSQPNTPGAADDGAGVAAILETVRALKAAAPMQHDVIVLLTDGEEYGLFGATAFLQHPWAQEVALVLNLEGRGNAGPSMTFEMSPKNGWLVKQYAAAAPYPYFSSLAYEIYSRMPNNTDFTVFKDAGYAGLNAAFIEGFAHYHKSTDTPQNLSLRSLQQHGSNLLALSRHFGRTSLSSTKARDRVFFNAIGGWVVNYKSSLNLLWVAFTTLLLFVTVRVALRQEVVRGWGIVSGVGLYLFTLVVIVLLFYPLNEGVWQQLPFAQRHNGVYGESGFFAAYLLLALGLFQLLGWLWLRRVRLLSLVLGVFILQFVLLIAVYLVVPNAAYLFLFPLLFSVGALLAVMLSGGLELQRMAPKHVFILLIGAAPAVLLLLPIAEVVFMAFALQLPYGMVVLALLLAGLLLPLLAFMEAGLRWKGVPLLPLLLLLAGGGLLANAVAGERPSAERPLHSHVSYFLNADAGKAWWASRFQRTDAWNRQFFTAPTQGPLRQVYPNASIPYMQSQAKPLNLPAPTATVLQDSVAGEERRLRLQLLSVRGAAHLEVAVQVPDTASLQSIKLAGQRLSLTPAETAAGKVYFTRYYGLPESKQAVLELRLAAGVPLTLYLYDQSIGLPPELVPSARPAYVVPDQGRDSNLTVVRKSYTF
ncbi:M20/M25/M40 family metallo-hydrolase [Pontibacter mangrovi]|uniref:Vacuolar membrane protease n=1 Tax=Pontibacter mangrovi TaxID=2589816 RepID=A0A501W9W6_9BACT|nr:M20/M25/M40 family metallo-hydrolase [Pontibacter mangrovi]TPE45265.1 M20/M25/M40 family metallo-hydrolase [Pontibacter mangrovi]